MSGERKAVFLSYASQDAGAAKRICEALRQAGVEVWFDQSELRGGDAWDANIRDQIGECALFVPMVSAATQARREGYFRLEWKLADDRTHLMAEGTPFILPVTIDGTTERGALVPKSFLAVQWTKLGPDAPRSPFVERVKKLLAGSDREAASLRVEEPGLGGGANRRARAAGRRLAAGAVIALLAVALAIWSRRTPVPDPGKPPPPAALPANDKSIAVLPFANMSEDRDGNAFFADGVHEDILTNLAHISELRVISRTSVMRYAATTKSIREIAGELGVAYVLEGSVRRAGKKVRVTGQLINGRTDEHLWAEEFTRDLTAADVFDIQTDLAQKIAASMQAAISPREKSLLTRRPTENLAAYDLWLKARDLLHRRAMSTATRLAQEPLLERAVELDPRFTLAWCDLSQARVFNYAFFEKTAARLAKVTAAIDEAVRLEPESPEVIRSVGWYYVLGATDWARAAEAFEKFARLQPNDAEAYIGLEVIQLQQGKWREALAGVRKAAQLDPGYVAVATDLVQLLIDARRHDEALESQRRVMELMPDDFAEQFRPAWIHFLARGSQREADEFFSQLNPAQLNSPAGRDLRRQWAFASGNLAEALRIDRTSPADPDFYVSAFEAINAATALAARGDTAGARARVAGTAAELRNRLRNEPTNGRLQMRMELVAALLGNRDEASGFVRELRARAEKGTPAERAQADANAAFVEAWTGDKDHAITVYAELLSRPGSGLNVHEMKSSPMYAPLKGNPRFEAILGDSKNNAPLF